MFLQELTLAMVAARPASWGSLFTPKCLPCQPMRLFMHGRVRSHAWPAGEGAATTA